MNPKFASAVDPIFLVCAGLARSNQRQPAACRRKKCAKAFRTGFAMRMPVSASKCIAKVGGWPSTALVSWIDDVLIEAPWPGRVWWENNSSGIRPFQHSGSSDAVL